MESRSVLAVVNDLFFSVQITEAAKRAGVAIQYATKEQDVLEKASANPSLIIFDLNFEAVDPLKLIGELKSSSDTKGISLIGYLSHVQGELKLQAQEAGCDMVMARSAFSQNMSQIFKRHAGVM